MEKKETVKKEETEKKHVQKERICIKCGSSIPAEDTYCYICGANQNIVPNEKTKSSFSIFKLFLSLILLLGFFAGGLYIYRYFDNSSNHINYSNKKVTIDDTGIADAVEKVYDSVVVVENYVNDKLYGTGSGFVYKTDNSYGYILTNNHVLSNATSVKVKFTNKETADAEVVGNDDFSDVAVLKVPKKNIIQVAEIGKNSEMRVGDTTFAVGTPLDSKTYSWSVTRGILSGKDRLVSVGTSYMNVLQTDTPINSGNSGGPLCNANGEVIGITNMKLASDQIEGMGFAIPIETALHFAEHLEKGESIDRPYLGISMRGLAEAQYYHAELRNIDFEEGVYIETVEEGSAASKAGLKVGDIIVEVDGKKVNSVAYLRYLLYNHNVGDTMSSVVWRDGKRIDIDIKLIKKTS